MSQRRIDNVDWFNCFIECLYRPSQVMDYMVGGDLASLLQALGYFEEVCFTRLPLLTCWRQLYHPKLLSPRNTMAKLPLPHVHTRASLVWPYKLSCGSL